jgi:hypothetical protein
MIIEHFKKSKIKTLYQRFDEKGRLLPDGVIYIDSWIDQDLNVCFQLMEAPSKSLLQDWIDQWSDLADFEIIPIISSDEAKKIALNQ